MKRITFRFKDDEVYKEFMQKAKFKDDISFQKFVENAIKDYLNDNYDPKKEGDKR